jgi:hypothetical protein
VARPLRISHPDDTHNGFYPSGTSKWFSFDKYGNKTGETEDLDARATEGDKAARTTTYGYDNYNRLASVKLPNTSDVPSQPATVYDYTPTRGGTTYSPYSHTTKSGKKIGVTSKYVTLSTRTL